MLQKKPYLFNFSLFGSPEVGQLSVAEYASSLPFELKRVYWVYNTPVGHSRGNAANKLCKYALVCLTGSAKIHIEDLQNNSYHFELNNPNQGLFIPEMHWRRIQCEPNAILLCIASEKFDSRDYIRDFRAFIQLRKIKI